MIRSHCTAHLSYLARTFSMLMAFSLLLAISGTLTSQGEDLDMTTHTTTQLETQIPATAIALQMMLGVASLLPAGLIWTQSRPRSNGLFQPFDRQQ